MREAPRNDGVGEQFFAYPHEGADDIDPHGDGARAAENGGGHNDAVLGEDPREFADAVLAREH
jgi:hypothetical protein